MGRKNNIINYDFNSLNETDKQVLALGLYTPSQSIATGELRNDSLQIIIGILAHAKFPARKKDLINCAVENNAGDEVIQIIKELPEKVYSELHFLVSSIIEQKLNSYKFPNFMFNLAH